MDDLIDDSVNSKESQVSYGGLKLVSKIAGKDKWMPDKLYNKIDIQKLIEGFTPKSTELIGLSKNEVMLTSLEILAFIFD